MTRRFKVTEMWIYRRITWNDLATNEEAVWKMETRSDIYLESERDRLGYMNKTGFGNLTFY